MVMNKILVLVLALVIISAELFSQSTTYNIPSEEVEAKESHNNYVKERDWKFFINYDYFSASSYIDKGNKEIVYLTDSSFLQKFNRDYLFTFSQSRITIGAKKMIDSSLFVSLEVPYSHYKLYEEYTQFTDTANNTTYTRGKKSELTLSQLDYLLLGGYYKFLRGTLGLDFNMTLKVPFGGDNLVSRSPKELWSDNCIELLPEIVMSLNFEKFLLQLSSGYNLRTEDLEDRLISRLKVGLYTIPDTYLGGELEWAQSLVSFDKAYPFDIHKEPNMENYLDARLVFGLMVADNFIADFKYKVRLMGSNTWVMGGYSVGLIYYLN